MCNSWCHWQSQSHTCCVLELAVCSLSVGIADSQYSFHFPTYKMASIGLSDWLNASRVVLLLSVFLPVLSGVS